MTIIYLNNEWLKPKLSKVCFLPLPIELIAVITGTLVSRYADLKTNYGIKPIGHIPTGFPDFEVPDLDLAKNLLVDGFIVAMVSYTVTVSMALIFAQKLNYEVNFNQELLAMGASNICGSFFSCLPMSASLSRSVIQQTAGGRTQIASLISCGILTFVLLWIGPFFELLPRVSKILFHENVQNYIRANLFPVCFSQYYSGCSKRNAAASQAIFPILENVQT